MEPHNIPPDDDHRQGYIAAIVVVTTISVIIAWLRMYTRIFISRNAWWDDWIMFISSFLLILTNGILATSFQLGLGRHIYYVPKEQIPECFKWLWAAEPTNLFALYAVRLSIALFFLRLIPKHHKVFRRIIWGSIYALTIADIYVTINYFIQCRPLKKVWLPDTPGECLTDALYAAAPWLYQAVSIIADLALVSIPIMMFKSLNLPKKTKIGVIALCCLGIFTCAIAVAKTALLPALFDHEEKDKTWTLAQLCLWAGMEICVGMICGSLPCLKPLYHHIRGDRRTSSHIPSSYGSGSGEPTSRSRKSKYDMNMSVHVDNRSRSEDSILPKKPSDEDIELGSLENHRQESDLVTPMNTLDGHGAGILRTTRVDFKTEVARPI